MSEEEIEEEITHYYSNLFTTSSPQGWPNILYDISQTISSAKNQLLTKPVKNAEIKKALFAINQQKSPNPDSMIPLLFQRFWNIVQHDIFVVVKDFLCIKDY